MRQLHLILLSSLLLRASSTVATMATKVMVALRAADFEVFGRVQGVFFRKYTKEQADRLGLKGWCKNTDDGTVLGYMEGTHENVESMMHWLKNTGSPSSRIDRAEFRNQKEIDKYTFDRFSIKRD